MRKLSTEKRALILNALAEGNSIASVVRMLGVNKRTVLRLIVDMGELAVRYHDAIARDLPTQRVQCDEIWSFVGAKRSTVQKGANAMGDCWTWVAIDQDSKLVISWVGGGRDLDYGRPFMRDLASRVSGRVHLSTDGLRAYNIAVPHAFGSDVDFAQVFKLYARTRGNDAAHRYSPGQCIGIEKKPVIGQPRQDDTCTSHVERQNLTLRMQNRRFTRLTNGFSKTFDNHSAAIAVHYLHYNFIRKHQTIKTTPAVAAGVADRAMTWLDFVKLLESVERDQGGRITDYQRPASLPKPTDWAAYFAPRRKKHLAV